MYEEIDRLNNEPVSEYFQTVQLQQRIEKAVKKSKWDKVDE